MNLDCGETSLGAPCAKSVNALVIPAFSCSAVLRVIKGGSSGSLDLSLGVTLQGKMMLAPRLSAEREC